MAADGRQAANPRLQSQWPGLSPHLLAEFYEVYRKEDGVWARVDEKTTVAAPLTEANLEATLNWQSPFEQTGADSKAPILLSMLQSGAFQPLIDALKLTGGSISQSIATAAASSSTEFMRQFEGRSGMTKLNSTQVFTGMQPVKFSVTALFRAWRDPVAEVEKPVDQLWKWALPVDLAQESTILSRTANAAAGQQDALDILMPSKAPVRIGLRYKGRVYFPLVIESINYPMGGPTTVNGKLAECLVQMSLGSLTAWGRDDWTATQNTGTTR